MSSPDVLLAELMAPLADSDLVHLNNAGVAPLTARAERASAELMEVMRKGTAGVGAVLKRYEHARGVFAELVGCDKDDLAFFQTCAAALSQVAFGYPIEEGQNVVLLKQEYPSNAYPWHRAAEWARAEVVVVDSNPDWTIDHERLCAAITEDTAVVAVSFVQYSTGAVCDLARVVEAAHKVGAIVVVDAIQGLGVLPFSMRELGVDAVAGGSHKWLCGPIGQGFLAVTPALRETLTPILQGAITYGTPDDAVDPTRAPRADIHRFEPGTPMAIGAVPTAASIELLLQIGVARLHKDALAVAALIEEQARRRGFAVRGRSPGPLTSPIVTFVPPGDVLAVVKAVNDAGVAVSPRGGGLRASPHAFNTPHDVERLFAAVDDALRSLS